MNIAYFALKALAPRARAFEKAAENPLEAQKRVLLEYLARNRGTEYGRRYKFSDIKSISDYQARVPLCDYKSLCQYIERIKKGEQNILTADKVTYFGITSGTTGAPKFIPVTVFARERKTDLMNLWSYYISKDHPGVTKGKILGISDPEVKGFTEGGLPYGPKNGHFYNNMPAIVRRFYSLPREVFEIKDYEARYYCVLRISMEHDVTTLATLNPSAILILCRKIEKLKERIIEDIEKGTINKNFDIPAGIRKMLEGRLRPNPRRAGELKAILEEKKRLLPKYFWPGMEIIECWKGGTVRLYLKELSEYFGKIPVRDFGCLSTEARNSIPISDEGAGGVLAIETNFYEFIPKEDMGKKERRVLLCDRLEAGREYLIIVTTPGGLCRYDIDDLIRVNGFFKKTPVIEFIQKGLNAISLTGEKIYESHINEAIDKAVDKHDLGVRFCSASVEMTDPPRYIFLTEFAGSPPLDKKRNFLKSIEEELCRQNLEYDDTRQRRELGPPALKVVRSGDFEEYRARRINEGAHETQFKVPKLSRDADFPKNFHIEEEVLLNNERRKASQSR